MCVLAVAVTARFTVLSPQSRAERAAAEAERYFAEGNYEVAADSMRERPIRGMWFM